ncbi:MAG: FeoB-associated Cys-rich membrane protein [Oscillospiraceae bacterium]
MNALDFLVIAILVLWTLLSIRWMWRRKKSGKCIGCCGDCSTCPSAQHQSQDSNSKHQK